MGDPLRRCLCGFSAAASLRFVKGELPMHSLDFRAKRGFAKRLAVPGLLVSVYCLFVLNYVFVISEVFGYAGFTKDHVTSGKLLLSAMLSAALSLLASFFREDYYRLIYSTSLVLLFFGQAVHYAFTDTPFLLTAYMMLPPIVLFVIDKTDSGRVFRRTTVSLRDPRFRVVFVLVVLGLASPLLRFIRLIDSRNLFLVNVYETRRLFFEHGLGIAGYVISPLARVVFPFLLVSGAKSDKKVLIALGILGVIGLYLLGGAVKSLFFGLMAAVFFMGGDFGHKERRFLMSILLANLVGLLAYTLYGISLVGDYIRRVFFVPAYLFNVYFSYYSGNHTLFTHSKLYTMLGSTDRSVFIPQFVGESLLGQRGLIANVGIFVEGFVSFGTFGVFVAAMLFGIFIKLMRKLDIDPDYYGIIFAYVYIINTSFVETLLVTHGLLFLIVFSAMFVPRRSGKEKCAYPLP